MAGSTGEHWVRVADCRPHGLLVVDKPRGPSSHDVVAGARRLYRTRRVGHAGTLDPMATGVLLLLFGEATKLAFYLAREKKRYRAVVRLGVLTDTLDAFGRVVTEDRVGLATITRGCLEQALQAEARRTMQLPPSHSALKVRGQRAYQLARSGIEPELVPRPVCVHELRLESFEGELVRVELEVSKGYYVRSFARDLGSRLGVPAHLVELTRLASGPFRLEEATSWPLDRPLPLLSLSEIAIRSFRTAQLTEQGVGRAVRGQPLGSEHFASDPGKGAGVMAWFDLRGELVALGEQRQPGTFRVVRGFGSGGERESQPGRR